MKCKNCGYTKFKKLYYVHYTDKLDKSKNCYAEVVQVCRNCLSLSEIGKPEHYIKFNYYRLHSACKNLEDYTLVTPYNLDKIVRESEQDENIINTENKPKKDFIRYTLKI